MPTPRPTQLSPRLPQISPRLPQISPRLPQISPRATQISIGAVHRPPGMPPAAAADALRGVRDGLAAAGSEVAPDLMPARLDLARLRVRLREGAGAREIEEAVRRAVGAAIAERRR